MILAQSLGEYGGAGGLMARFVAGFSSGAQWIQQSFREDSTVWIAVAVCVVLAFLLFRAR